MEFEIRGIESDDGQIYWLSIEKRLTHKLTDGDFSNAILESIVERNIHPSSTLDSSANPVIKVYSVSSDGGEECYHVYIPDDISDSVSSEGIQTPSVEENEDFLSPLRKRVLLSPSLECVPVTRVLSPKSLNFDEDLCEDFRECSPFKSTQQAFGGDQSLKISNIPSPFVEELFVGFIERSLCKAGIKDEGVKGVVSCGAYDIDEKSVVVEFSSSQLAKKACSLRIDFLFNILKFEEVHHPIAVSEQNTTIIVGNIPPPFVEELLTNFLERSLVRAGLKGEGVVGVVSCGAYSAEEKSVTLKLSSPQLASEICALSGIDFLGYPLQFEKKRKDSAKSAAACLTRQTFPTLDSHSDIFQEEDDDGFEPFGSEDEDESQSEGNTQAIIEMNSLDSEIDTLNFILSLTEHKRQRPHARWGTLFTLTIHDLEAHFNIITSSELCRRRLKSLNDQFRKCFKKYGSKPISWPFFCLMGRLRGENVSCVLTGHSQDTCPGQRHPYPKHAAVSSKQTKLPHANSMAYLSKGSFFSTEATKTLIHVMGEFAENFEKMERNSAVWEKVKKSMDSKGFQFEKTKLQKVYQELVQKYKNFKASLSRTGQGRIEWEHYDDMCKLMEGNVAVEPLLTCAVGSSNVIDSHKEGYGTSSIERSGKTRPPGNPRSSTSTSNTHWRESMAQCLSKLVDHITEKKSQEGE